MVICCGIGLYCGQYSHEDTWRRYQTLILDIGPGDTRTRLMRAAVAATVSILPLVKVSYFDLGRRRTPAENICSRSSLGRGFDNSLSTSCISSRGLGVFHVAEGPCGSSRRCSAQFQASTRLAFDAHFGNPLLLSFSNGPRPRIKDRQPSVMER